MSNFTLHQVCLASDAGNSSCRTFSSAVFSIVGGHDLWLTLTIDPIRCVIEHLVRVDWVLKVMMSLWDVLLGDGPIQIRDMV